MEAAARWGNVYGYVLRSDQVAHLLPPTTSVTTKRPALTLYYYRQ